MKKFYNLFPFFLLVIMGLQANAQGADCANPIIIGTLPYSQTAASTCGMLDDYSISLCNSSYIGGDDIVYTYTPASNELVNISLSNISDTWSAIHILDACPDIATTCIAYQNNTGSADYGINLTSLTGGVTYYIVISTFPSPQCIASFDLSFVAITCQEPTSLAATNIATTTADLSWTENGSATTWNIEWGGTGFIPGAGTMVTGTTTNPHNLTGLTVATTYDYYVQSDCGSGDFSNWAGPFTFITPCTAFNVPWSEGFESISAAGEYPACISGTGDFNTEIVANTNNRFARTGTDYAYTSWTADDWFFTAGINLTAGTSYDFSTWYNTDGLAGWDTTSLWVGNDQLAISMTDSLTAVIEATNTSYMEIRGTFVPSVSGVYYFGTHVEANGSPWYVSFDDFLVELTPTCSAPSGLSTSNTTAIAADFGWTENGSATQWQIEWDATGFAQGAGNLLIANTNPNNITGLTATTSYDFYVRSICGVGDTSLWTGPYTFSTPCMAFNVPWLEGFESITVAGEFPSCVLANGDFDTEIGPNSYNREARTGTDYAFTNWTADDWFFTAGINLTAGTSYDFSSWFNTDGNTGWDAISLWVGSDQNSTMMTDSLISVISALNTSYQEVIGTFVPSSSGVYYFGIRVVAGGGPWYISFDDLKVDITPTDDLSVIDVTSSAATGCSLSNIETITIKIVNMGMSSQSNFDVGYTLNGTPITPETISTTVSSGDTLTHTFVAVADMSTPMVYNVNAYTLLAGDQNGANDTMAFSVNHITPSLAFNDSLYVSDNVMGGTHGIICTNGLLPTQLDNCYKLSAVVIDSLVHTWDSDLDIYLITPNGDSIELSLGNGGSGDDYIGVVFTDTAANSITTGTAGFAAGGYYSVEDANGLGSYIGFDPNGMWDLWLTDGAGGDNGTLYGWHLEFQDYSFTVDLGADSSLCSGQDSLMLDAGTGTYTYTWSTLDSTQTITVSDSTVNTVNFSVVVTDSISMCEASDTISVAFGDCSSISELSESTVRIYPNPSNGNFIISLGNIKEHVSVQVVDMQGRIIYSQQEGLKVGKENSITLNDVERGVYLVAVSSTEGKFTQTIIIE